ncbi:hypothetical protein C0991_011983 [Blastosporella zonata]|nr:hypothetical protein C0991_011983 [Blastosporella zonata]
MSYQGMRGRTSPTFLTHAKRQTKEKAMRRWETDWAQEPPTGGVRDREPDITSLEAKSARNGHAEGEAMAKVLKESEGELRKQRKTPELEDEKWNDEADDEEWWEKEGRRTKKSPNVETRPDCKEPPDRSTAGQAQQRLEITSTTLTAPYFTRYMTTPAPQP